MVKSINILFWILIIYFINNLSINNMFSFSQSFLIFFSNDCWFFNILEWFCLISIWFWLSIMIRFCRLNLESFVILFLHFSKKSPWVFVSIFAGLNSGRSSSILLSIFAGLNSWRSSSISLSIFAGLYELLIGFKLFFWHYINFFEWFFWFFWFFKFLFIYLFYL